MLDNELQQMFNFDKINAYATDQKRIR